MIKVGQLKSKDKIEQLGKPLEMQFNVDRLKFILGTTESEEIKTEHEAKPLKF